MDYRLGQIVDCVDGTGIGNNTIIIFSSDNGAGMINVDRFWEGRAVRSAVGSLPRRGRARCGSRPWSAVQARCRRA